MEGIAPAGTALVFALFVSAHQVGSGIGVGGDEEVLGTPVQ